MKSRHAELNRDVDVEVALKKARATGAADLVKGGTTKTARTTGLQEAAQNNK
jgi:hypothetical protein